MARIVTAALLLGALLIASVIASIQPTQYEGGPVPQCKAAFTAPEVTVPYSGMVCNSPNRDKRIFGVTSGEIPDWLRGTLYRNVIAQFECGQDQVRHFFDGLGQIMAIRFENATSVSIAAKTQNTTTYQTCQETQSYPFTAFATCPHPGQLNFTTRQPCVGNGNFAINNDVSLAMFGNKLFSTTDANIFVEFDGETLDVLSPAGYGFADNITGNTGVAHGPVDQTTGEYFNLVQDVMPLYFGGNATTYFWSVQTNSPKSNASSGGISRRVVGKLETPFIPYSHSFGVTDHYVVWLEQPLRMNKTELRFGAPFLFAMEDASDRTGLTLHLVSRVDGTHRAIPVEANDFGGKCFYHTGNVFEDVDGSVVYDFVLLTSCKNYDDFMLQHMLTKNPREFGHGHGYLTRVRWYPHDSTARIGRLADFGMALFPWYNKQFHMRPYRYAYTTTLFGEDGLNGQITKFDLQKNESTIMFKAGGRVLTEALFVPRDTTFPPAADSEEDGLLITVAFDYTANVSEIIGLRARDLGEQFVVRLPFGIPLHLHGIFCKPGNAFCVWN